MSQSFDLIGYDIPERPRVLLCQFDHQEDLEELLAGLIPKWQHMTDAGMNTLHAASWSAVISREAPVDGKEDYFYLQFGGKPRGTVKWSSTTEAGIFTQDSWSEDFYLSTTVPEPWRDELKRSMAPALRAADLPRQVIPQNYGEYLEDFEPLAVDADGNALGAIYRPAAGGREVIYLPEQCELSRAWLELALKRWSTQDPEAFPPGASWAEDPQWMSPAELDAAHLLTRLKTELGQTVDRLDGEIAAARRQLSESQQEADAGIRRLLTASADDLKDEVAAALRDVGFDVEDRDAVAGRQKHEDLRVEHEDFVAVVEVKGSTKGASTTHLLRIEAHVNAFREEMGGPPSARWYVFNSFRDRDPSRRSRLFKGQDGAIRVFAAVDGLAIDTKSLFSLRQAVTSGEISRDHAREMLKSARGLLNYPASDDLYVDLAGDDD